MTEQQQAANVILANTALYTVLSIVLLLLVPASVWLAWWLRKRKRRAQLRRTYRSVSVPLGDVSGVWRERSRWKPTVHDWTTRKHLTPRG